MAWECDELIAASGGDWTTLNAFEGNHDGDTPSNGTICQARVRGVPADTGTVYWDGWQSGMNATTKIVIVADTGCATDGTAGSGTDAIISDIHGLMESTNPFIIDLIGLEFTVRTAITPENANSVVTIINCFAHGNSGSNYKALFDLSSVANAITVQIGGCLIRDNRQTGGQGFRVYSVPALTVNLFNCTAVGNVTGFMSYDADATLICTNCAGADSGTNAQTTDFSQVAGTLTKTNCKWENDASGTLSHADGVDFTEPSTDDYTPVASGELDISGTSLPSWYTDITAVDMKGTAWAANPSCGCFQVVSGGSVEVGTTTDDLILTEYSAIVNSETDVTAGVDALIITENAADVNIDIPVSAGLDALVLTEYSATIKVDINIQAGIDALVITENVTTVNAEINITTTLDALSITESAATVNAETNIVASIDALVISTFQASIQVENDIEVIANTDSLIITENAANVNAETSISAGLDALAITANQVSVNAETNVSASIDSLAIASFSAGVNAENNILAGYDDLIIAEYAANVSVGGLLMTSSIFKSSVFNGPVGEGFIIVQ